MREYKTLSAKTKKILEAPEGYDVDFKSQANGVKVRDIVAFANTPSGGTILVGVEEMTNSNGVQRGRVIGCSVDDDAVLQIRNKACDCIPPVDVEILTENLNKKPILRVEIAGSKKVPHCTKTGEYSIRTDRRTRGLWPEELLSIYLNREAEQFLGKFRKAIEETEGKIDHLSGNLQLITSEIMRTVENLQRDINADLQDVFSNAEDANMNSDEANGTIMEVYKMVHDLYGRIDTVEVERRIAALHESVNAILHHLCIKDADANLNTQDIENLKVAKVRVAKSGTSSGSHKKPLA